MFSAEQQQMEAGEFRGAQSQYDVGSPDVLPAESHDAQQHESLATTVPRKRVALDVDSKTNKISARIIIRNRSMETVAFKNQCCVNDGYYMDPDRGILGPGQQVHVMLIMDEMVDPLRDVEQDKCTIGVAPYNSAQYPDLEDFLANNFDSAEKLEKHTMLPALSSSAKMRLAQSADEQSEAKRKEDEISRMKRFIYPAFGALFGFIILYVIFYDFCTPFCDDPAESKMPPRSFL